MRIIRPYGTSRSHTGGGALRRVLIDNTPERKEHPIPEFAVTHDELVIAQWISTIDKIARKPKEKNKPSPAQYALRTKLGKACWLKLIDGGHLPGAADEVRKEHLRNLWWFKIHPYPAGTQEPRRKDGKLPQWAEPKGRWYQAFAGDCEPEQIDPHKAGEIAARIEKHLYETEYRLASNAKPKRRGRIEARAESIAGNVLHLPEAPGVRPDRPAWRDADIKTYTERGDPAETIRAEAMALEKNNGRMSLPVAAKVLFEHWPKVFSDPATGVTMSVKEAMEKHPGPFALHQALKQCYRRLLKRARKDTGAQRKESELRGEKERGLSTLLPRNLEGALRLSRLQADNAELAELVRLGKVIHYEASRAAARDGATEGRPAEQDAADIGGPMADHPAAILTDWPNPEEVAGSSFWQSDGQAEIKRAEAFVRIWRHALVLAGLTLKDLVGAASDILGGKGARDEAVEALRTDPLKQAHFDRKRNVLFGEGVRIEDVRRQSPLHAVDQCELAEGLIDGAAKLRHAVFHFKGRRYFLDELAQLPARLKDGVKAAAQELLQDDAEGRTARLKAELDAVHVPKFLMQDRAVQVFALLAGEASAELPLPRFARVLERGRAWAEDKAAGIRLPEPANRRDLEDPARLCQYGVLKRIYERPFRSWLARRPAAAISGWYETAVARSSAAAREQNAKGDAIAAQVITARAAGLKPARDGDIVTFLFDLSRETASEMRVQRGYESDADKAREQAAFIDNLLRDVAVQAFSAYLTEANLNWALELKPGQAPAEPPLSSLDNVHAPAPVAEQEEWPAALYLLLHLLPVEAVGQLLHQLFRWNTAATRETKLPPQEENRRKRLEAAMTLYLDMHDAKFEGGKPLQEYGEFRKLFARETDLSRVFPEQAGEDIEGRVPKRGLREIMRFGHLPLIEAICGSRKIDERTITDVSRLETAPEGGESQIAQLQKRREELHDRWVKQKHLDQDGLRDYCATLADVAKHRHAANFVYLVDHVRAHRLVMAVLGRLVDYAGLFERDLYFVTLALLQRRVLRPADLLTKRGLRLLSQGRIISALEQQRGDSPLAADVGREIERHFNGVWARGKNIRNKLAHLDMLQGAHPSPSLTDWVNKTRELMAYDRKLKNAVSKSVIELLAREGIALHWTIKIGSDNHDLADAKLSSRCAGHLGNKMLKLKGADRRDKGQPIAERLHSDNLVAMIAKAFDGEPVPAVSILDDLSRVDWEASAAVKQPRRDRDQGGPQRPPSDREKYRHGSRDREYRPPR
jgi:hypothetical protein